jgi:ketosteroid isomerase-like protein
MSAADREAEAAVVRVYEQWAKAFRSVDGTLMKSLWDHDYDGLVYQAEESADPIYDWAGIAKYWDEVGGILLGTSRWDELTRKVAVTGDAAFVYVKTMTSLKIAGLKNEFAGELRSTLGLHRRGGRWLLIHYHESRALDMAALFAGG